MDEQVSVFQTLIDHIRKRYVELIIIAVSTIVLLVNMGVYASYKKNTNSSYTSDNEKQSRDILISKKTIIIDISGGIVNSGVYEVSSSARLNDVINKAGGLSEQADFGYFERTFNRARFISDGEKIYIPTYADIQYGFVSQSSIIIESEYKNNSNANASNPDVQVEDTVLTNINTASEEELDELPGIGVITAEKIISNRPYLTIEELLERKIVKSNVYEQIKNMVGI